MLEHRESEGELVELTTVVRGLIAVATLLALVSIAASLMAIKTTLWRIANSIERRMRDDQSDTSLRQMAASLKQIANDVEHGELARNEAIGTRG